MPPIPMITIYLGVDELRVDMDSVKLVESGIIDVDRYSKHELYGADRGLSEASEEAEIVIEKGESFGGAGSTVPTIAFVASVCRSDTFDDGMFCYYVNPIYQYMDEEGIIHEWGKVVQNAGGVMLPQIHGDDGLKILKELLEQKGI